ncbi:hypothetical protein ES708_33605 [subsurface metagenome]
MSLKSKEEIREYNKKYYKNNLEKIREYRKNNREKKPKYAKKYRENNPKKIKKYCREYYKNNIEKIKKRHREYYKNNREKVLKKTKQYQKNNREARNEYNKRWRKNNHERLRVKIKQWTNLKLKTDLKFYLNHRMSCKIWQSLKSGKNGRHWESLVGYKLVDLIKHLKKTIPETYNWQGYLSGNLHIDHIIPISAFNFTRPEHIDFKRCWALKNLRLLPAKENLIKHAKLTKPFQPALRI